MPEREAVTVELDVEVAAMLREHAAAESVSEGEIVEALQEVFGTYTETPVF